MYMAFYVYGDSYLTGLVIFKQYCMFMSANFVTSSLSITVNEIMALSLPLTFRVLVSLVSRSFSVQFMSQRTLFLFVLLQPIESMESVV